MSGASTRGGLSAPSPRLRTADFGRELRDVIDALGLECTSTGDDIQQTARGPIRVHATLSADFPQVLAPARAGAHGYLGGRYIIVSDETDHRS